MSSWRELKNNSRLKSCHDQRIEILKSIREFFWLENFKEVETPMAVRLAGQEPYLNPVEIVLSDPSGKKFDLFLRTSPEYSLKKILAAGYDKVFEISKCFRNGEDTKGIHSPEFTMLEWYRCPGNLSMIMDDTEKLFKHILNKLGKEFLVHNSQQVQATGNWDRISVKELFESIGEKLDENLDLKSITKTALNRGYSVANEDQYEDIFFKIFLNEIEPQLGQNKPVFVYDYPAQLCSLSNLVKDDPRYAERFELYVGGLEVANAFGELLDPEEQNKRLEEDQDLRNRLNKKTWPVDQELIDALAELNREKKQAGGIALGVDRMVVLCTGARDINETIFNNINDQFSS